MANPEENKEAFYIHLKDTLNNVPNTDKLLLIGDLNARIGRENDRWPSKNMGSGNAIPMVSFYWHYALSSI